MNGIKIFAAYLKLHIKSIMLFSVFAGVFCIVFWLSNIPLEPILYALLLCLVLSVIITMIGYIRFYRKHRYLVNLTKAVLVSLSELPETNNLIEKDYYLLLNSLFEEKSRIESEYSATISDLTDYYTLWAHQIKTPIAAMRLLLQNETKAERSDVAELEEQLFRIEQYVGIVLQYVRTESTSTDYVISSYDTDDIIRECLRKYAKLFIRKKITLNYSAVRFRSVTDRKWLSFVISQLLDNAIKYSPEGGTISIYADPNKDSSFIIEDNGIGISPEDLPRVCDKGYTGYNGRMDKKSTGIGLYLCKQIMTKLSHGISFTSELDKGTKVYLSLGNKQITE